MECDPELLPDQVGDPGGRPELGGEAELRGRLLQPGEDLAGLDLVQPGLRSGVRDGVERPLGPIASSGDPAADAAVGDAEDAGDLGDRRALLDGLDGALPAPFEFPCSPLRSHAPRRLGPGEDGNVSCSGRQPGSRTLAG